MLNNRFPLQCLVITIAAVHSEILNLRIDLDANQKTNVLMTDGTIVNRPINATWRSCGIGPGVIFIHNEYGICQTMDSFNVARGSVNQQHRDPTKSKYYGSTLTFIQQEWLDLAGTLTPEFYKVATMGSPGRRNDQGVLVDISLSKGQTINDRQINGYTLFRLGQDTTIVTKNPLGSFCSVTSHQCAKTVWSTGATPDEVFYGEGLGKLGFIVIKSYPNQYPYARVILWPGDDIKYFPQELTQIAPYPIGVTFETALKSGLKSVASDKYSFKQEDKPSRKKRFVSFSLATAALVRVEAVDEALRAALAVSDMKDREHEAAIIKGFEYTRILGEKIANTMETSLELNERTYTLSLQNEVLGIMLDQLSLKVDYLEQYTLFTVDYFQSRESVIYQNLEQYRKVLLEKYPGSRIITEQQVGTAIYYTLSVGGNIISSNTQPPCSLDRCYLPGKWYKYLETKKTILVENPLVGIYDCGIYFQTPGLDVNTPAADDANLQVVSYFNTIELALSHLKAKKFPYVFTNLLECPTDFQITAGMLTEANKFLSMYGFDQVKALTDNRFLVNCTPHNITDIRTELVNNSRYQNYIQEDIVCSQRISYEELRSFVARIQPPVFSRRNALDSYKEAFNSATSFERVMSKLGNAGISALTELIGIPADVITALASGDILRSNTMSKVSIAISIVSLVITLILGFLLMCFIAKQGKRKKISTESSGVTTGLGTINTSMNQEE